ncbi:MAG: TetR/AcrR family transcriptional regulator [Candidatus Firestonebacteria bacterium]|mgnify:CR=1 FL=1
MSAEIRERIVKNAGELFLQFGFSKVTMDEIAKVLGMSKKTLYKFFPTKEKLLKEAFTFIITNISIKVNNLMADRNLDFIEKLRGISDFLIMFLSKISPYCMQDLKRNAFDMWQTIEKFRRKNIMDCFGKLIEDGKKRGVIRKDCNTQVLLLVYLNAIQGIVNPEVLSQLPITASEGLDTILKVFFEGVLTKNGRIGYIGSTSKK